MGIRVCSCVYVSVRVCICVYGMCVYMYVCMVCVFTIIKRHSKQSNHLAPRTKRYYLGGVKDILSCSELEVKGNHKSLLTLLLSIPVFINFLQTMHPFTACPELNSPTGGHAPLLPAMGQVSGSVGSRTGNVKDANSIGV